MRENEGEWSGAAWFVWVFAVGLTVAASLASAWFIVWGDSTTCGEAPTVANRAAGFHHFSQAALVIGGVWAIAAVISRRRWGRMIVGAALGLSPFLAAVAMYRHVGAWQGGFCF